MASTTFVDGDLSAANRIVAAWLNDVNVAVYTALGAAGVAPTTAAAVIANLGISVAGLGDYEDDAAAASGGVAVGGLYRDGSILMIRVA
jgi:hypothetical protein